MAGKYILCGFISRFSAFSGRWTLLVAVFLTSIFLAGNSANAQTKSLKLYYLHTGEKAEITFKKNGQYLASGLKKINWHLRDWRRNEPTKMDPQLLDLVWEAYRQSGSKAYIHVISGYRSPASNTLLRKRGRGVAKNSQHTRGKALDFFLPDVKLKKMREIGLKMGVGGVGYYPKSGSPFVHFDTGSVRHWPRMNRRELAAVFPKGDTMHVPTDGKPLARYQQAVAEYKRKKATGTLVPKSGKAPVASLFARLTARNNSDDEEESSDSAPAPRAVATKVQPVAPEPEAEKPQFASLPKNSVPVPVIAPRGTQVESGAEIAIAAAPPAPAPAESPDVVETDPAIAREETVDEAGEESAETALASLVVPVPLRRPAFEPVSSPSGALAEAQPTTELALVDTAPAEPGPGIQVAALTPSEIEDLRSRVRSTIGAPGTSPVPKAPVPAASILTTDTKPVPPDRPETASVATTPAKPEPVSDAEPVITTASLEAPKPVDQPIMKTPTPIGIEPGVQASGNLPIPMRNPSEPAEPAEPAPVETAALETETSDTVSAEVADPAEESLTRLALAKVPLPARNPLARQQNAQEEAPVVMAALQGDASNEETATTGPVAVPVQRPQLAKRTISLDRFSAPQENSTSLGKFALASNITIRELADVRAPAYGRNVIREVPKTILVQGFNLQPFGPGKNNFQGKAVTAMKFALQRIN